VVGAWCFVDHYGPDDVARTGGMDVPPHPHTGLQTVMFTGEIEHRDSSGVHAWVRAGELNLMTGGYGVAHSEVSTPHTTTLHGVQLCGWPCPTVPDTFLGTSPTMCRSRCTSPVRRRGWCSAWWPVLVETGSVLLDGTELARAELGYRPPGADRLALTNPCDRPARVMLLGGEPFTEPLLMWWNFVGRSYDEIVEFREEWETGSERFGRVEGYRGQVQRLPAPPMPPVRIKPRLLPPGPGDRSAWG
jgi:hypothetical protein